MKDRLVISLNLWLDLKMIRWRNQKPRRVISNDFLCVRLLTKLAEVPLEI